ncbi:MAG TPA: peptidase M10, partial [Anaeromyxobacter sp.]
LAHAPSSTVTMFATTSPGELEKRSLSADDVAGVCAIYPDPSGGCGCGRGEGAGAASLLVASLALRRRRRAPAQTTTSPA